MKCPHCGAATVDCGKGQHCNNCGCCFVQSGRTLTPRPGHPVCNLGSKESYANDVESVKRLARANSTLQEQVAELQEELAKLQTAGYDATAAEARASELQAKIDELQATEAQELSDAKAEIARLTQELEAARA